jgi:hypothetical protein
MFGQLLLIVKAFGKALQVVLLISVIVVIMIYALGIVCTQMIGHNAAMWGDKADDVTELWGTIPDSMCSLFWIMFGCGWSENMQLLAQVYPVVMILLVFACYMVITVSLMALIVGLISESLIIAQQEFKQRKLDEFAKKKKPVASEYTEELNALLEDDLIPDGEPDAGCVKSADDLKGAVKGDAAMVAKLQTVGVTLSVDGLASLVDSMTKSDKDHITINHFVEKLINLSGNSSASQLVDVKFDILKNRQRLEAIESQLDAAIAKFK